MPTSAALLVFLPMTAIGQYTAVVDGTGVTLLTDKTNKVEVAVATGVGNIATSMKVNGAEVFWSPQQNFAEWKAKPAQRGNPFLAPWANRIEGISYWVNGKEQAFDKSLGNIRPDSFGNPIHGMVMFTDQWKVLEAKSDSSAAWVKSRLDLSKNEGWMKQFPFPHAIDMTYRLSGGELEIITEIQNLGKEKMPVAIGYHPWFQIPGGRDTWTIHIPAKEHVELSDKLIPTGKRTPMTTPDPMPLKGAKQDDVYTSLVRDSRGRAEFWLSNGKQKLSVIYGPKYIVGVVYAPPGRDVICFEPMAAITDAFNQHHRGQYSELQFVAPGQTWRESFWIKTTGF